MNAQKLSIALNILMAALVLAAWTRMALRFDEHGALTAAGLHSLKYFTVLSNLLQAAASILFVICALGGGDAPRWVTLLRYAASAAVTLTFATVMVFLGPSIGYGSMFQGANLFFHLVVPLLSLADICLVNPVAVTLPQTLVAAAPAIVYGVGYALNLLLRGMETNGRTNDWYGFARGGLPGACLSFVTMLLAAWLIAVGIRACGRS